MQIELRKICKRFDSVNANQDISITFSAGCIYGILGENGAGKSTLMKILSGYTECSSGETLINNQPVRLSNPMQALRYGIGMLYQEPMDFPRLTVLDNYRLGNPLLGRQSKTVVGKQLTDSAVTLGFQLQPDQSLETLTIGERQQLEILRLLSLGVDALILDEPTTGISTQQKEMLFSALRKLAGDGKTILLVSHKIKDVEALCDHVAVLRRGSLAIQMDRPFSTATLLESMFGEPPKHCPPDRKPAVGVPVLTMDRASVSYGRSGLIQCSEIVREREIIGLAGLEGSGQEAFLRLAAGLLRAEEGSLRLRDQHMKNYRYHELQPHGVFFMPAARLEEGLISEISIADHMALIKFHETMILPWKAILSQTENSISAFDIKGRPSTTVNRLSGGNQQRLLLSFIPPNPSLLLLENPTRGLDMASSADMWSRLRTYCQQKTSIVFSSPDLEEILTYADRILVFFDGCVIRHLMADQTDINYLGSAIAGAP